MNTLLLAAFFYLMTGSYLAARGVEWHRIAAILRASVPVTVSLAVVFALFALVGGWEQAEALAAAAMLGLMVSASRRARDEILGAITPAGIVLLNVAVNMAGFLGPLPMNFAWLAMQIPVPYGPLRIALNLLVLYAPALLALFLMHRGPRGGAFLRFFLGLWVCWVGIAALAGPGWHALKAFRLDDPSSWLISSLAAYAALHLGMLALNLMAVAFESRGEHAESIARSVRVDSMRPIYAILMGIALWAAARQLMRLELSPDTTAAVILAVPFAVGELLARRRASPELEAADERLRTAGPALKAAAGVALVAVFLAAIGLGLWRSPERLPGYGGHMFVNTVTGTAWDPHKGTSILIGYAEPDRHASLRRGLERDGIPFAVQSLNGREVFRVKAAHRAAALRVRAAIDSQPSAPAAKAAAVGVRSPDSPPPRRSMALVGAPRDEAFTAWLTAKGEKWRIQTFAGVPHALWEDLPGSEIMVHAFDMEQAGRPLGIDHYATEISARRSSSGLDPNRSATFDTAEHRLRFERWLQANDIAFRHVEDQGRLYVVFDSQFMNTVNEYVQEWSYRCRKQSPPPADGSC